jgi:hypothetical protein
VSAEIGAVPVDLAPVVVVGLMISVGVQVDEWRRRCANRQ